MSKVLANEAAYQDLKTILSDALRDVAPLEKPTFDELRTAMLNDSPVPDAKSTDRRAVRTRGFPGIVEASVYSIHLLTGTLALIEMYQTKKLRREERELENEIRQEWTKALIQAGMSPELANLVPVKRCPDMIRFLTTQLIGKAER
jgi:hypothetical protein